MSTVSLLDFHGGVFHTETFHGIIFILYKAVNLTPVVSFVVVAVFVSVVVVAVNPILGF